MDTNLRIFLRPDGRDESVRSPSADRSILKVSRSGKAKILSSLSDRNRLEAFMNEL
jgi:hypothetical protein